MAATVDPTLIGLRYAHAFADVAVAQHLDAATALRQMKDFAGTLSGSKELREVLEDPSIPAEQKLAVIDAMAERMGLMREVRNFLALIVDHQRLDALNEIIAEYDRLADAEQGIIEAEVTSAHELHGDDRAALEASVSRLSGGGRVRVHYLQDAALLGGAVVKIGSTVYDGSLRAQLEQMKQSLVSA
jgi:F-type H+-transporting ATPase subunit delta